MAERKQTKKRDVSVKISREHYDALVKLNKLTGASMVSTLGKAISLFLEDAGKIIALEVALMELPSTTRKRLLREFNEVLQSHK